MTLHGAVCAEICLVLSRNKNRQKLFETAGKSLKLTNFDNELHMNAGKVLENETIHLDCHIPIVKDHVWLWSGKITGKSKGGHQKPAKTLNGLPSAEIREFSKVAF